MKLINKTNGNTLAESLEVADTPLKRMRGLLGRTGLEKGEGLHIIPCNNIHSFFMKFRFDAVFIDKKNRVKAVIENMPQWNTKYCFRAYSVIELPAGTVSEAGIKIDDELEFV